MATRAIGLDYDGTTLRAVLLRRERGRQGVVRHAATAWDGTESPAAALQRLGIAATLGDRVATALAPTAAYTRTLHLPFTERRQLEATVPLELAAQLPLPLDDCIVDHLAPRGSGDGSTLVAAAVPAAVVAATVAPFDRAGIPLQTVDLLTPLLEAGLARLYGAGLTVVLGPDWALTLHHGNDPGGDYRLVPLPAGATPAAQAALVGAALGPSRRAAAAVPLRIVPLAATQELAAELARSLPDAAVVHEIAAADGTRLPAAFLPALLLAQRALPAEGGLNFRRGAFARHGEWAAQRKRLVLLGALLAAALLLASASAGLRWWGKARSADRLREELATLYREAVPDGGAVVDVPLQLRARLAELTRASRPGGQHPALSPLAVLRAVSAAIPAELPVTLREWEQTRDEVRLTLSVPTFDAIDRLTAALTATPLCQGVRVVDSRSSADRSRVDAVLLLTLQPAEALP